MPRHCYRREEWIPWKGIHSTIYLYNPDARGCLWETLKAALKEAAGAGPGAVIHVATNDFLYADDFYNGLVIHHLGKGRLLVTFSVQAPEPVTGRLKSAQERLPGGVVVEPVYDEATGEFIVYAIQARHYPVPADEEAVRRLASMLEAEVERLSELAREHAGDVVEVEETEETYA